MPKTFDYESRVQELLTPAVVKLLTQLHEHRGKQELYLEVRPDSLEALLDVAKVQSTGASNAIEGIYTTNKRLEAIVCDKADPQNRSEEEIAGYRDILALIHESYEYMPVRPSLILQLHSELYSFTHAPFAGSYKDCDNVIANVDSGGSVVVRFQPTPAFLTADAMRQMCDAFRKAQHKGGDNDADPLLVLSMFVLDFLCVHPFNDGNGRMSRLLTLLLLYQAGYLVGKYVSIEMLIEGSKETYYQALRASSAGWHENTNSYEPFVRYYLGVLLKAYREFESRLDLVRDRDLSKPDRIRAVIAERLGRFTKKELMAFVPDISKVTVERTLAQLVREGVIQKVGAGPSTGYVRLDDKVIAG